MTAQGWRIPDGLLDDTRVNNYANDQFEYERAFREGSLEEQKMALCLTCADPSTPEKMIRSRLSVKPGSVRPVSMVTPTEPTIDIAFQSDQGQDIGHTIWDVNNQGNMGSTMRPAGSTANGS